MRWTVVLALLVACAPAPASPPTSTPAGTATTVAAPSTTDPSVPIQLDLTDGRPGDYAGLAAAIDTSGLGLARVGIEAYRFVSTVEFVDRPRLTATYVGEVTLTPPATRLVSSGLTGMFLFLSSADGDWYLYRGRWFVVPANQGGFRWSPAGPIPSHAVASIISRIALRSGTILDIGIEHVLGREVRRLRRVEDTLEVDVLITADGVVLGLEMRDELPHADRIVRWAIDETIDEFDVDPPL